MCLLFLSDLVRGSEVKAAALKVRGLCDIAVDTVGIEKLVYVEGASGGVYS